MSETFSCFFFFFLQGNPVKIASSAADIKIYAALCINSNYINCYRIEKHRGLYHMLLQAEYMVKLLQARNIF